MDDAHDAGAAHSARELVEPLLDAGGGGGRGGGNGDDGDDDDNLHLPEADNSLALGLHLHGGGDLLSPASVSASQSSSASLDRFCDDNAAGDGGTTRDNVHDGDDCDRRGGDVEAGDDEPGGATATNETAVWSVREELASFWFLGWPMAVSFFARMGMASTDSSFVGHLHDGKHDAGVYLASAALSDMVTSVMIVPPLAFNSVLNPLCAQAKGTGENKMAGVWLMLSIIFLTLSSVPCVAAFFYVEPILKLFGFSADICRLGGLYARFNVVWPIPNGIYQCMRFYANGIGVPRPAMWNNMFWLLGNAALNWLFVYGGPMRYFPEDRRYFAHVISHDGIHLHWKGFGFVGAAISLSCSRTLQMVTYWLYFFVWKKMHVSYWPENGWSPTNWCKARYIREYLTQAAPLIGSNIFSVVVFQSTTVLIAQLGKASVAASSAIGTVTILWAGAMQATFSMVTAVRVGYHLGKRNPEAAKRTSFLTLRLITYASLVVALIYVPLRRQIVDIATDDDSVLKIAARCIPAVVLSSYANLVVNSCTSGIFSAQGRTWLQMVLTFGLEIPLSVGLVAYYVIGWHGSKSLLGVYWLQSGVGGFEAVVVILILLASNWKKCSDEAIKRQRSA